MLLFNDSEIYRSAIPPHFELFEMRGNKKKMRKKILREKDEVLGKSARFDLIFCRIFNSKMKRKESFMFGITWKEKLLTLLESSIRKSSGPRSSRKLSVSLFRCK